MEMNESMSEQIHEHEQVDGQTYFVLLLPFESQLWRWCRFGFCPMVVLWFRTFLNRSQRLRVRDTNGVRTRKTLSLGRDKCFADFAANAGEAVVHAGDGQESRALSLHGLMRCRAGVQHTGPLTNWTREESVLWEYWRRALDGFSFVVEEVGFLRQP